MWVFDHIPCVTPITDVCLGEPVRPETSIERQVTLEFHESKMVVDGTRRYDVARICDLHLADEINSC